MRLSIYLNKRGVYRVKWVERKKKGKKISFLVSICVAYNRSIIIITTCSWGMIMVSYHFYLFISSRCGILATIRCGRYGNG